MEARMLDAYLGPDSDEETLWTLVWWLIWSVRDSEKRKKGRHEHM